LDPEKGGDQSLPYKDELQEQQCSKQQMKPNNQGKILMVVVVETSFFLNFFQG